MHRCTLHFWGCESLFSTVKLRHLCRYVANQYSEAEPGTQPVSLDPVKAEVFLHAADEGIA